MRLAPTSLATLVTALAIVALFAAATFVTSSVTISPTPSDGYHVFLYRRSFGEIQPGDYVFVALINGGRGRERPLSSEWYNQTIKQYARAAGLPTWVHAHTLRHTAAHLRLRAGQSVLDIQRLLAHASLRITQT